MLKIWICNVCFCRRENTKPALLRKQSRLKNQENSLSWHCFYSPGQWHLGGKVKCSRDRYTVNNPVKSSVGTRVLDFHILKIKDYSLISGIEHVSVIGGCGVTRRHAFTQGRVPAVLAWEGRCRHGWKGPPRLWVQRNQLSGCAPTEPLAIGLSGRVTQTTPWESHRLPFSAWPPTLPPPSAGLSSPRRSAPATSQSR